MGLDAFVRCNCYKEGRTKRLPLPEEEVYIDEDGYLDISPGLMSPEEEQAHYKILSLWMRDCCPHKDMEYYSDRVGNWYSVSEFKIALDKIGKKNFSVLLGRIPDCNGGCLEAELAGEALRELCFFRKKIGECQGTFLRDADSGRELYALSFYGGSALILSGKEQRKLILREQRVEIWDLDETVCYFSSGHYRQDKVEELPDGQIIYRLTDILSGAVYDTASLVIGEYEDKKTIACRELEVIIRRIDEDDYRSILTVLEKLCKASLETGNPIIWC